MRRMWKSIWAVFKVLNSQYAADWKAPHVIPGMANMQVFVAALLSVCAYATSCFGQNDNVRAEAGWGTVLTRPIAELMIDEAPTRGQLESARLRTYNAIDIASHTKLAANYALAARACWLQINLEYRQFLDENDPEWRINVAERIPEWAERIREYLWDQNVSMAANESPGDWADALLFVNSIDGEARIYAPPRQRLADSIRLKVFEMLSPATGSDSSESKAKQTLFVAAGGMFADLRKLANAAISAKVQAANALQKLYGSPPTEWKKANLQLGRIQDFRRLYPSDQAEWGRIEEMIGGVTTANQKSEGVVGDYFSLLNGIGWSDPVLGIANFEADFFENAPYPFKHGEHLKMLDQGYDPANSVALYVLMKKLNAQVTNLAARGNLIPAELEFQIPISHRAEKFPLPIRIANRTEKNRADIAIEAICKERDNYVIHRRSRDALLRQIVISELRDQLAALCSIYLNDDKLKSTDRVDRWVNDWASRIAPKVPDIKANQTTTKDADNAKRE